MMAEGEAPLATRIDELLASRIAHTEARPALAELHRLLRDSRQRLQEPMRLAIIGRSQAGKSTALNALLGESVMPAGNGQATGFVARFRWGEPAALCLKYRDGRPDETRSLAELERTVLLDPAGCGAIDHLDVCIAAPLLQQVNLIDTPGLTTKNDTEVESTRRFVQQSEQASGQADAVLYLFSKSIGAAEHSFIEEFTGPALGDLTPVTAIGALTKIDTYWPAEPDPKQAAARIVERLQAIPRVRSTMFAIAPLSGHLGLGAQTLTDAEFAALARLARLPPDRCNSALATVKRFTAAAADLPVDVSMRQQLISRLGWYGVWLACSRLRNGIDDRDGLKQDLLDQSGLPKLRQLLQSHFGNRSYLIKLNKVLRAILELGARLLHDVDGEDRDILRGILQPVEQLFTEQHQVRELSVLQHYYEGNVLLDHDEAEMLLQVSGEMGTTCGDRLGLPGADPETLLGLAADRMRYWKEIALDPGADLATSDAASTLARSYELIGRNVREAQRHLDTARRYLDYAL